MTRKEAAAAAERRRFSTPINISGWRRSWLCAYAPFLLVFLSVAASQSVVQTLPGYDGDLPFYLETGYVGVGDLEYVQLFYYFVKSSRSPEEDPLMLWITGGPGCSSLTAFFYENGPLSFDAEHFKGGVPKLHLNPFTWTQSLNVIFLDAPVGTGFSYSNSSQAYYVDDIQAAAQAYDFLRKWLVNHPEFLENILYIGGDSYSGIPIPIIVKDILDGNEVGREPVMNFRGYILGNPVTDSNIDDNSRIPFAHRVGLISDRLYESAKSSCNGNYIDIDPSNEQCVSDVQAIDELVREINTVQVLEPTCSNASPEQDTESLIRRTLEKSYRGSITSPSTGPTLWCRNYLHELLTVWANNKGVQDALHVQKGTKAYFQNCNTTLAYTKDVTSVVSYHRNFSNADIRALIFSGDHDMSIPYMGTEKWILSLNVTLSDYWRAWFVDGQVAGYTEKYTLNALTLTFATVKGGGHFALEYKIKEGYAMANRWFAYYPL